jgi:ADP-ribosylglycohydrolase
MAFSLFTEPDISVRFEKVKQVSSITHAHARSIIGCFIYVEFAIHLIEGLNKLEALRLTQQSVKQYLQKIDMNPAEVDLYRRVLNGNIANEPRSAISGSGYVLHALEASLWCLLTTENYSEATLKAVNLGEDTDTTAAITGGIAGIYYGFDKRLDFWRAHVARFEDIEDLIERFTKAIEE